MYSATTRAKTNPLHWIVVFLFAAACVSWMLVDTTPEFVFKHSVKYQEAAVKSLQLDDTYRVQMQRVSQKLREFCDRGSHIVFAHNVQFQGERLNDHMFHVCGGSTWINARVVSMSTQLVQCQEEYANTYRTRHKAKEIHMRAVDVDTWSEREVTGSAATACRWQHAIDILENKWL
jgi:hypothetical protein|tara:strand:- start:2633 stop:3160 length:528 start_codon:yes stop_codon:yes gene_type:complete